MSKLTEKQERFISEYLIDMNATQAAIRAGYSDKRASEIGYQLLQKTPVKTQIQERLNELSEENKFSQNKAREMYEHAYKKAEETGQTSTMVAATKGLCKLYGLEAADKIEVSQQEKKKGVFIIPEGKTMEDCKDEIEKHRPAVILPDNGR